ncbi:hypothetical protein HETIRDRAFT_449442 [Heterobasidion irregulare TC 32-1]|uniref:Uncharacterized protein n=1 Tax=Heterobasidion irregulare (strain TC 32-1) TaxID=747525 RepID=W4KD92_HETIT|nr:uncharacterized protein HETIRDRAFT_449442 [Heterobasidion irregulare TC 32-1]ETW83807.1 hypothetical protein HETIRDRAFT_449442 [Heterobasidion irregulare TC 32-1]
MAYQYEYTARLSPADLPSSMMDRARITDRNLARKLKLTPTLAPSPERSTAHNPSSRCCAGGSAACFVCGERPSPSSVRPSFAFCFSVFGFRFRPSHFVPSQFTSDFTFTFHSIASTSSRRAGSRQRAPASIATPITVLAPRLLARIRSSSSALAPPSTAVDPRPEGARPHLHTQTLSMLYVLRADACRSPIGASRIVHRASGTWQARWRAVAVRTPDRKGRSSFAASRAPRRVLVARTYFFNRAVARIEWTCQPTPARTHRLRVLLAPSARDRCGLACAARTTTNAHGPAFASGARAS